MRKTLIMAVAALVIATPALAEDWDFVLVNNTGKEIKLVELAPTGTTTWHQNKVDEEVRKRVPIAPGKRGTIFFEKESSQCRFDIKATFADDTTMTWINANVCDNPFVNLKLSNGAPTFTYNAS
jgi:hypothetical protein